MIHAPIVPIRQPHGTKICGQCCVAMIAGVKLSAVLSRYGYIPTNTRQLAGMLLTFRVSVSRPPRLRLLPWDWQSKIGTAIVKIQNPKSSDWHWVVWDASTRRFIDPAGMTTNADLLARATSYLPVSGGALNLPRK